MARRSLSFFGRCIFRPPGSQLRQPFAGQRLAVLAGLLPLILLTLILPFRPVWAQPEEPVERAFSNPVLIQLDGMISPLLEQFMARKLEAARARNADLVILEIDSPGGFVTTTLGMAEQLRDVDWAHTVAYIPREAISGAAIVSLACNEIVMAPLARIGDAGQIMLAEDNMFRYVPEKQRSMLVRHVRDLAEATGRPPAVAEAMVDKDLVVYRVRHRESGDETFMSEAELAAGGPDQWEKLRPVHESREGQFLTVNGRQAVELKLAEATVDSRQQLWQRYALPDPPLVLKPTAVDTAVFVLNLPLVTGLLFVVGLIALYIELSAPGLGLGGLIAGLCFSLFFWSRFLGGTAGWLEVILFLAGVAFVAVELFVLPGFGIAGFSGVLLILASILMASQHFLLPTTGLEMRTTLISLSVLAVSGIVFLVAAAVLSRYLGSLPVVGWLVLEPPEQIEAEKEPGGVPAAWQVRIGQQGVSDSPLRPAGKVLFGDNYVDVITDGSFVDRGRPVKVIKVSGNVVMVREIEGPPESDSLA